MSLPSVAFKLATVLGAVAIWASDISNYWSFEGAFVGDVIAFFELAWAIGAFLRNRRRRRRRSMEMRDSALG